VAKDTQGGLPGFSALMSENSHGSQAMRLDRVRGSCRGESVEDDGDEVRTTVKPQIPVVVK
jgi:hypothetical protein